ncbi:hypothetical protein FHX77_000350 [Bifidobacterium commune]|uniref:Uncharacterized protein n=1 Tax=Bifidobacterium commune TaxID=1505727 RepID=A0A1C4H2Q6_9BIFI|nr:DUF5719 family protein [Bifidobacterium commune]MBB2954970.1 hypothetical protein [Bifidobacterium commune]SCC79156.1 hypothetical protein GA0061077_0601 [Bifidobacterium commune]
MKDMQNTMNDGIGSNNNGPALPPNPEAARRTVPSDVDNGRNSVKVVKEQGKHALHNVDGSQSLDEPNVHPGLAIRAALGMITILLLVLMAVVLLLPIPSWLADPANGGLGVASRQVSQTDLTYYCPSRMALSDSEKYGDSAFQQSEGDIASSARFAAFGSVYQATVGTVGAGSEADSKTLTGDDSVNGAGVKTYSGSVDKGSNAFEARLLKAKSGTGAAASVASWASVGDLKGLSASTCVTPSLEQDFLLGPTTTGSTQQLSVANFSGKPTSLEIRIWSTKHGSPLQLSTGNVLNVGAHAEATQELSAAAPGNEALFVTVKSKETPIAAVVRNIELDGLSAKGSDYVAPLMPSAKRQYLPGISADDEVKLMARSARSTDLTLSWVDDQGDARAKTEHLDAGKVSIVELGKAPQNVSGLRTEADESVDVAAKVVRSSQSDTDFTYVDSAGAFAESAIVQPDHTDGTLSLLNTSSESAKAALRGYDASGNPVGDKDIDVPANAGLNIDAKDVGADAVMYTLKGDKRIVMGMRLKLQSGDDELSSVATAYLSASGLEPQSRKVWVQQDAGIVH